jgi:DNA polymerase IV
MSTDEPSCPFRWPKAILLVDLNAFFASIEQRDFPELRGCPVAVTNGSQGTCIITSSYEARAFGVKTGMRFYDAIKLCPELIQRPSRPEVYAEVSATIMQALEAITPDIEIFSVDEAFLDVTHCQRLHGTPVHMARMVKNIIFECTGLLSSVGVSGDKTTAKYAAKLQKPDGLVVIPPWEAEERLSAVPVTELCGVADGIGHFLASHGVYRCGDMKQIPVSVLGKRFGNLGRRIWLMAQGKDPEPVQLESRAPKSLGHGKVLPPHCRDERVILNYFAQMCEKVAHRLRRYGLKSQHYYLGYSTEEGWSGGKYKLILPEHDGAYLFKVCRYMMSTYWSGEAVRQIQVTALDPQPCLGQADLFTEPDPRRDQLHQVVDKINDRYGNNTIMPGRLVSHQPMPNVIAPAWRPSGIRRTV